MSRDRREEIIVQLMTLAAALPGIRRAVRNEETISGRSGPLVAFWEGDESCDDSKGVGSGLQVDMSPEIRILTDAAAADIGTQLNTFRLGLYKAIMLDDTLKSICGRAGGIFYRGLTTETARGERIEGGIGLNFVFRYPMVPDEL